MVTRLLEILLLLAFSFLPTHARRDVEVMQSCIFSHMSEGLSKRKIDDVETVLSFYNRNVLTLRDSVVKAFKYIVADLEVFEDELSKEVYYLKKKISSLKKSCEATKA
ncbi:hypothetical protein Adt_14218 [Abeliophyllum distichum]|uniref:Uncharacterized protein n=1 Tax=Abeliophyllum distichum TaxID=126358 RepID=A0ABD1TZ25_9LAMI